MGKWFGLEEEPWNWHSQKFRHITLGNQTIAHLNYYDWSAEPNISLVFSDHLGSASILADSFGRLKTLYDYYPFGSLRQEVESGGHLAAQRYTGQELDEELDLYNYGARFYSADNGKFIQSDPLQNYLVVNVKEKTGKELNEVLSIPQGLNAYSYAVNNPIKNTDPTGEYWETIFDMVSLGLSLYDFNHSKSFINGLFLGLDVLGVATPLPSLGHSKNAYRTYEIAKYFHKVGKNIDDIVNLGGLFVKNANFKFNRAFKWSKGEAGNDVGSMVGHFFKHGDEVGAKDVGDYYNKANDFIESKSFTNSWQEGSDTVYYNKDNNLISILNEDNQISSYYKVTDPNKLSDISKIIDNN